MVSICYINNILTAYLQCILVCIADICSCKYQFVEQPLHDMCNPYALGWFATQCVVEHTTNEGAPLDVEWYTKDSSNPNSDPDPFTSGIVQETTDNDCNSIKSVLNVTLKNDVMNNFGGHSFFCRVKFSNGTVLNDSRAFLLIPEHFSSALSACGNESVQSGPLRECINYTIPVVNEPGTPQPVPTYTTSTTQSIPKITSAHVSTTPLPSATPDPGISDAPDVNVNGDGGDGDTNVAERPLNSEEEILIYSAIGIAVFLFLVVFLLVVCVCIWSSVFRQKKINTAPVARNPTKI